MEQRNNTVNYKWKVFSFKVKEKLNNVRVNVANWVVTNKEGILFWGPMVIGGITTGVKVVGRIIRGRQAKEVKDLYCYDNRLGHYWRLRRELSNAEWLEIDRRKNNGERLSDILASLKVLK